MLTELKIWQGLKQLDHTILSPHPVSAPPFPQPSSSGAVSAPPFPPVQFLRSCLCSPCPSPVPLAIRSVPLRLPLLPPRRLRPGRCSDRFARTDSIYISQDLFLISPQRLLLVSLLSSKCSEITRVYPRLLWDLLLKQQGYIILPVLLLNKVCLLQSRRNSPFHTGCWRYLLITSFGQFSKNFIEQIIKTRQS